MSNLDQQKGLNDVPQELAAPEAMAAFLKMHEPSKSLLASLEQATDLQTGSSAVSKFLGEAQELGEVDALVMRFAFQAYVYHAIRIIDGIKDLIEQRKAAEKFMKEIVQTPNYKQAVGAAIAKTAFEYIYQNYLMQETMAYYQQVSDSREQAEGAIMSVTPSMIDLGDAIGIPEAPEESSYAEKYGSGENITDEDKQELLNFDPGTITPKSYNQNLVKVLKRHQDGVPLSKKVTQQVLLFALGALLDAQTQIYDTEVFYDVEKVRKWIIELATNRSLIDQSALDDMEQDYMMVRANNKII